MSKENNLHDFLTDIADAVREKKGTSEPINAQNLSEEIRGIESGGDVYVFSEDMVDNTGHGTQRIKKLTIPTHVTRIEDSAYFYLKSLVDVIMHDDLTYIGYGAFNACTGLTSIKLPRNLVAISTQGFAYCSGLNKTIIMPESLEEIGNYAFSGCSNVPCFDFRTLKKIPRLITVAVFNSTTGIFVVPDALYDEWINATNWSTYADRIVKASEFVEPTE